jgi:predicted ATPase
MLTDQRIRNFKCYQEDTAVAWGRLNVLTGSNSRGKSTLLQPLLCLRDSMSDRTLDRLQFNGSHIQLGSFEDVKNLSTPSDRIEIEVEFDQGEAWVNYHFDFTCKDKGARWAHLDAVRVNRPDRPVHEDVVLHLTDLELAAPLRMLQTLHYVGADRLGPKDFFPRQTVPGTLHVGARGEFTAEVLFARRDEAIAESMCAGVALHDHPAPDRNFIRQVGEWMAFIFDGAALKVSESGRTTLAIEMNSDGGPTYLRMPHLGFGFSYVLPIIVAGLLADPDQMLIVENPEAHLTPAAQSRMGLFLARVAQQGIQVFLETHSEHVLNGTRLAIVRGWLPASDVGLFYIHGGRERRLDRIGLLPDARLETWPRGFFDQQETDLIRLFG